MNKCCLANFEEYAGQLRKTPSGGYEGCDCSRCMPLPEIKIKLTHKRRTKNNFYRRLIISCGDMLWYMSLNFDDILFMRERKYTHDFDDVEYEKPISELPHYIKPEFDKYLNKLNKNTK